MTEPNVKDQSIMEYFLEQNHFMDEVATLLNSVSKNLHGLYSDITCTPPTACLDIEIESLQQETETLCKNTEFFVGTYIHSSRKAMSELHSELVRLRLKYKNLQNEWDKQQEHLGRMQQDLYQTRNQIQQQSQFCASLGAVMGNLVWKASRIPPVVDMLLAGNKVGEFLSIVNGSLVSFMETYGASMPGQCADESQFIMSFCGIVTNIAAAPAGRQFLANNPVGKDLLEQFSRVLPLIPVPSGNSLKRLLLMALYNTSINQNGLRFLQRQKTLLAGIAHDLQIDSTFELKLMALRLLQSLTYEIPDVAVLKIIQKEVPMEIVQPMAKSAEPEMKEVVKEILQNINRAMKKYERKPSNNGDADSCGCNKPAEPAFKPACGVPKCPAIKEPQPPCRAADSVTLNCFYIPQK